MNNMANMANMGAIGGPVGASMPMMNNNGALQHQGGPRPPQAHLNDTHRTQLNTYIYEYFMRQGMFECARSLYQHDPDINVKKEGDRRDENGNPLGGLGDDPMDTDIKDIDQKRPDDLPAPNTPPMAAGSCFLYEWFCLFWDIANSQKGKGPPHIQQYVSHTQAQSRLRQQEQQQNMLRNLRPPDAYTQQQQFQQHMMRNMPNGAMNINMKQGTPLQRAAMANNQNPQAIQMLQQKAAGMQRGPSDMDGNRGGPASPGSTDNAPSPSKRPRLDGGAPFNPSQAVMMQNGRPAPGMQGQQQHHSNQMPNKAMTNAGGPQGQGSPMVQQGGPDGPGLAQFYNPGDLAPGAANMRPGPGASATGSNHALQDYQMQLMLLEQQNKKRLMMARQEQDIGGNSMQRPDGQGGPGAPPGPGGQNFPGASPPGGRNGASPNPSEQMKRANQQMGNAAAMGSPLPDGAQSRSSPNSMNFMGQSMDPNSQQHFFKGSVDGMSIGMAGQMNGTMRPPSSHPVGQPFNGQMNAQQQMMAAAQRQGQGGPGMPWPGGAPNGQMPGQGPPVQGTPQPRPMAPPSAPAAAAAAAGSRNATSSPQTSTAAPPTPQQAKQAAPKKKENKNTKSKAAAQKKGTNITTAATPVAEPETTAEPPTPATPITPVVNPPNFAKNQNVNVNAAGVANGQPAQAPPPPVTAVPSAQHPDQNRNNSFLEPSLDFSMDFANPLTSGDVLNDFDFDSFLHDSNNGEDGTFDFNAGFMEGSEIGAE